MFKVVFKIENGGGNLFSHKEFFQIISTGRYTWRSKEVWKDNLTTVEEITVKSNRPFTIIKTTRSYTEHINNTVREIYQETYAPENNSWSKYI